MTRLRDDEFPLLKPIGLRTCPIRGDGNCLFNALSDQIYGHQEQHSEIRERVIEYMRENPERFKPFVAVGERRRNPKRKNAGAGAAASAFSFAAATEAETDAAFEAHLKEMARGGAWGDNIEIMAFSHAYNTDVKIYEASHAYCVRASDDGNKRQVAHIAYHTWQHYSSIRNIKGPMTGLPHVQDAESLPENFVGMAAAPKGQAVKDWMTGAVASSLHGSVDHAAIIKALEESKGDINIAVNKFMDDGYSSSQRSSSFDATSTNSSSIERDPDSDDDESSGPNKRNRLSKTIKPNRKAKTEPKQEAASISRALPSPDISSVGDSSSSDEDDIRGPNIRQARRIKAAKALRKENKERKKELTKPTATSPNSPPTPQSLGTEVKVVAATAKDEEEDQLPTQSAQLEVKSTTHKPELEDDVKLVPNSDPSSAEGNGSGSEFAVGSNHGSTAESSTSSRRRPKLTLRTKSMQKPHAAPKVRVTARDRKAQKKAAQKQARKESKRTDASSKLTNSTTANGNTESTSPPVEKVVGMKTLFI